MTLADEARELAEDERRAREALTAVRREIDEAIAAGAVPDEATAAGYHGRLEAAQERLRLAQRARRELSTSESPPAER